MRTSTAACLLFCLCRTTAPAWAQGSGLPPIAAPPQPDDLDEVEDLASDEGESGAERGRAELTYSQAELRSRHLYGLSLTLGPGRPWQSFSLASFYWPREDLAVGLYAGSGRREQSGIVQEKSYDLEIRSRATGITARYYLPRLEWASVEGLLGYVFWDGRMSPHGQDDVAAEDRELLTATFRAHGISAGLSLAVSWLWENGLSLDWTLFGVQTSEMLGVDYSRQTAPVQRVARRAVESPSFYGLSSVTLGYFF